MSGTLRINGVFNYQKEDQLIDIFGYATKGIPGLDIVGLGKHGRMMKEKFVFISRQKQLQFPLKRFVLCLEDCSQLRESSAEDLKWLELPLLIVYWSLAGHLKISELEDCLCSGFVKATGEIVTRIPSLSGWQNSDQWKMISHQRPTDAHVKWISLADLFK